MKQIFAGIVVVILLSCAWQHDDLTDAQDQDFSEAVVASGERPTAAYYIQSTFNTFVGKPVTRETAEKWIDNYKTLNGNTTFFWVLEATELKEILTGSSCVGISFTYASNNARQLLILPMGVDHRGKLIKGEKVFTQVGWVDWKTAMQWVSNYSGVVRSHFFGADTFSRLLSDSTHNIVLIPALDDSNNPQLLLSNINSRHTFEDGSWPCPPVCPGE